MVAVMMATVGFVMIFQAAFGVKGDFDRLGYNPAISGCVNLLGRNPAYGVLSVVKMSGINVPAYIAA